LLLLLLLLLLVGVCNRIPFFFLAVPSTVSLVLFIALLLAFYIVVSIKFFDGHVTGCDARAGFGRIGIG